MCDTTGNLKFADELPGGGARVFIFSMSGLLEIPLVNYYH